ncbi:DNA repair protein RadC [Sphingomonas sp. BGYR3]|uniref:RadC family protein n=1 Tax=Sphingomonas sp. BGYR3 TaxID=2975483 RepID=UPI0021A595CE|nr:DNA repair protein RadC [Sphingomonas sp. BGYR3]MDG5489310.1 DNA repair protein RadC [Sphingomonas sp. BGYR3]
MNDPGTDGTGHRERLRKRLLASEGRDLHDHELVEYLLATAQPRGDTKGTAKRLLAKFGSLPDLLAADVESIRQVEGAGDAAAAAIKIVRAALVRTLRSEVENRPVLSNWQALLDYLRGAMAHVQVEQVRVLHLNTRNALILDDELGRGTIDEAPVYIREVVRRALDFGSAAIILVHNHPSGDPSPSRADIDLTKAIVAAGKPLNISVHDHLIIGRNGHFSMRANGLI